MTSDLQGSAHDAPLQYGRTAATLHWVSAIVIIFLLIQGLSMTKLADGDSKTLFYQVHVSLGYVVLILSIVRIFWARRDRRPDPLPMSATEYRGYKAVHYLLVAGAIITSVAGILLLIDSGIIPISPEVTSEGIDRGSILRNAHFVFALGLLVLLLAHVGGIVAYERRNGGALMRMRWPRRGAKDA